jgi:hypothetical protein
MYSLGTNINLAVQRSADRMRAVRDYDGGRVIATHGVDPLASVETGGQRLGAKMAKPILAAGLIGSLALTVAASL